MERELGLGDAILSLAPSASWTLENDDLERLNWIDDTYIRPTNDEIVAELERLQIERAAQIQQAEDNRVRAIAKLKKLGLTKEELLAVIGL